MARNGCVTEITVGTVAVTGCNGPSVRVAAVRTGVVVDVGSKLVVAVTVLIEDVTAWDCPSPPPVDRLLSVRSVA